MKYALKLGIEFVGEKTVKLRYSFYRVLFHFESQMMITKCVMEHYLYWFNFITIEIRKIPLFLVRFSSVTSRILTSCKLN